MLQKISLFFRNRLILSLLFLFFVAIFFRFYLLNHNLFWGPEQGIDFLVVKDLVIHNKITLIGAKTDVSGIFHGPIYYYVSAIPFFLSGGNPLFISFFLIFLNCLTVFFIYFLGKEIFNKRVGIIASVLFTFSFNAIVYARWLSTHPLAIPLVTLYFLFLVKFFKGSKQSLLYAAIALGLLAQTEFLNILFFGAITLGIIVVFFSHFKKQKISYLVFCGMIASLIAIGPFVLFDLRHNFLITNNLLHLASGSTGYHTTFMHSLSASLSTLLNLVTNTIVPSAFFGGIVIFFLSLFLLFKEQKNIYRSLIFIWLFIPPLLLILLHHDILDQYFVALIPAIILLAAFLIDMLWKKKQIAGIALLFIFMDAGFFTWIVNIPENNKIFFQSTQLDLKYSEELKVIDWIYQEADGKPFSFQSYTIPYWSQQGWTYLFWQYGKGEYGYEPVDQKAKILFVIIQNDPNNKSYQEDWLRNTVSKWGTFEKEFTYGALRVQKLNVEY